ncbi:transporter substrate-binding domain-containing protein [Halanaerocella petrolearia]
MKKILLFSLLIGLLVVTGCGQQETSTWSQVKEEGKLVVGMSADYKPFEYPNKDNEIVGFDVDILKAITDELGVELKLKDTAFDGLIPGLKTNKYDIVASAMTITEKRQKAVNFSDSYFDAGQVIAVTADNNQIKKPADLKGKTVAVQLGTTGDLEVSEMDGIKKIKRYEKITQAYIELKNGRVDAVVNDKPVTKAYIDKNPEVKMVDEPFTSEKYGIAFKKGDKKLLEKVNGALKKIKENGTYDEIYDKWFK